MGQRKRRRDMQRTIMMLLMGCALLAGVAGLLGKAYGQNPVEWGAWTFTTTSFLGVTICFGLWTLEP